jgi:hypothetical protein
MTELRCNDVDPVKEEKTGKKGKNELSKFERFMEKGKELMKGTVRWMLVGATVTFLACGSAGNRPEGDADVDTTEEVTDTHDETDALPDSIPDIIEDDSPDVIDDETDVEDGEDAEEELPPLECPEPVENTPSDLNDTFEESWADTITTSDGRITSDTDFHLSMNPDVTYTECPTPDNGGYRLVCVGDSVNIEGQNYLLAGEPTFDATLEPASSETSVCPAAGTVYPILAGASETFMNVTYEGISPDSVAGFTISSLDGFYFDINGAAEDVTDLAFTASSAGVYLIYFKRDIAPITFNSKSLDGRGNESTNSHDAALNAASSRELYYIAFNEGERVNYDVDVNPFGYTGNITCARCSGGPTHYEVTIPLPLDAPIDNACGQLGLPSDIRFDVTSTNVSPPHLAGTMTVTARTNVTRINGPSDNPSLVFIVDYTGPSDFNAITMRASGNVVVEGVGHVCSSGVPFTASYPTTIYAQDPDDLSYSVECGCTFGG